MWSTSHSPQQDHILHGRRRHVDPAHSQRPPTAVRAGVLHPEVEHGGVSERAPGSVELLGLDAKAHHLAPINHSYNLVSRA